MFLPCLIAATILLLGCTEDIDTSARYVFREETVQNIAVSERDETNITVYASDLTTGMLLSVL